MHVEGGVIEGTCDICLRLCSLMPAATVQLNAQLPGKAQCVHFICNRTRIKPVTNIRHVTLVHCACQCLSRLHEAHR
jgi:hypothetical protein